MRAVLRGVALAALLSSASFVGAAPRQAIALDSGWQARIAPGDTDAVAAHRREARWFAVQVPGSIQQDLIAQHRAPDPFLATNEGAIQWIGRTDWQYRHTLVATPALLARDHLDLVFDGLGHLRDRDDQWAGRAQRRQCASSLADRRQALP